MRTNIPQLDTALLGWARKRSNTIGRVAISIIFIWFGALKVIDMSPAYGLVEQLLQQTLPAFPMEFFFPFLGWMEMLVGALFLVPKWTRVAVLALVLHMITTFLPLVLLPGMVWTAPGALTLEGQYIVKNIAIVTLALALAVHIKPLKK